MPANQKNPDITVRGGLINVPAGHRPPLIPRHQPNTPINKKAANPKPDHQPVTPEATAPDTKPKTKPAEPPPAATATPEGDKNNVPTETGQSD